MLPNLAVRHPLHRDALDAQKGARGGSKDEQLTLGPQSPPSSSKSPGCRSRSGPGGPVVASPASFCSSSQRWTRARTKALVGTPLRRLWRRRRAWAPSSRRTDIDFRKGPISARTLHEPTSTRHRPPRSGARAPARPSRAPPDATAAPPSERSRGPLLEEVVAPVHQGIFVVAAARSARPQSFVFGSP